MSSRQRTWAVVLAAGDGTRLASLTRDAHGNAVPKQFCSLNGGEPLIAEAIQRARRIAPRDRVCAVVAEQHRRYWRALLWTLPARNIIVQPSNCGTANGILLATLSILSRDLLARIVFLPADHYVRDERVLGASLRETARLLTRNFDSLALVGIEPEEADPELGYVLPGARHADGALGVERFVEKPTARVARELIASGALWNSFIFGAWGPALLAILRKSMGGVTEEMATALACDTRLGSRSRALAELYARLPIVDFSRAVMQGAESLLRVIAAPACGWSDLGTPKRVADTLRRLRQERLETARGAFFQPSIPAAGYINLSAQHARLEFAP